MSATDPNDPRLGLPSASSFEVDCLCHGRQQLLASLPPEARQDVSDPDATFGLKIHKARETGDTSALDEEQLAVYERGIENEKVILEAWKTEFKIRTFEEGPREARFWMTDPDTMQPLVSAQLDVHYVAASFVLVVDWKTMWCSTLTPAERNWQSRIQAIVAAREYDANHVRHSFNKAMFKKEDTVDYTKDDLAFAQQLCLFHLRAMREPGAQRTPGNHCRFCAGKGHCPENGAWGLLPSVIASNAEDMVARLSPEDLAKIWERSTVIHKILEATKERLKTLPDPELTALGIGRRDGRKLDPIVDTNGAVQQILSDGLDLQVLWKALSFSKTELTKIIRKEQGWTEAKAKAYIDTNLDPFIERKQSAPSLYKL